MDRESLPRHADIDLHNEIAPKARLDAILESPHLTTEQAIAAMNELHRENQATFPHIVVSTVMVHATFEDALADKNDGVETRRTTPYVAYAGPFRDRRTAEAWAAHWYAGNEAVSWATAVIKTPAMLDAEREELRRITD